jgi:uncharacterized repeat protein (TIGR03806 family)
MLFRHLSAVMLFLLAVASGHAAEILGAVPVIDRPVDLPVCAVWAPGDPHRMFVVEQHAGTIRVVRDGVLLPTPFLTISDLSTHQEQGLLSVVFDPDYGTNGHCYVYYSDATGDNHLMRYTRKDAEQADPASARELFKLDHPDGSDVHYGSFLGFNPKDLANPERRHWLYVTVGEGGGNNAPAAQNPESLFGKILRLDVDPAKYLGAGQLPYGIPAANPALVPNARREWIALGVRNPWRGGFDRQTGDLWFGDVGDTTWEEVNRLPYNVTGLNFQWPAKEASLVHRNSKPATLGTLTEPVHFFPRGSVIGGTVYRGAALPGWRGAFFFADFGSNTVRSFTFPGSVVGNLRTDLGAELGTRVKGGLSRIVSFAEDEQGELYVCEHQRQGANSGMVYRIRQDTNLMPPSITTVPLPRASAGFPYAYDVRASGNPAPTFTLLTAPAGMTIDAASGAITWTPTAQQVGTHHVVVQAANGQLPNAPQAFQIAVADLRPADVPTGAAGLSPGLEYAYYEDRWPDLPTDLAAFTPQRTGIATVLDLTPPHRKEDYALRFSGYLLAPKTGLYAFQVASDDGSTLSLGNDVVVDARSVRGGGTKSGAIGLAAGWQRFTVAYHQRGGGQFLRLQWMPPGATAPVAIPATALGHLEHGYGLDSYAGCAPYLGTMPNRVTGRMPETLSATGAFADTERLVPAAALLPYAVNAPLWSDGAEKQRWMAIPSGSRIGFSATGNWNFPAGSVLVKHFALAGGRRLETRFLVVTDNGAAYGVTYQWRADQRDADLLPGDAPLSAVVGETGKQQTWTYPSRANCLQCHSQVTNYVLGARTSQLNGSFTYAATGRADHQLRTLASLELFDAAYHATDLATYPRQVALTDTTAPVEARVRSYLDTNCMMCHQPGGAAVSQFDARMSVPLARQGIINGPVNNPLGIAGAAVVVPGDPERSLLLQRLAATDPAVRMPSIGTALVDQPARDIIAQWIRDLPRKEK